MTYHELYKIAISKLISPNILLEDENLVDLVSNGCSEKDLINYIDNNF